jgi:hypothetical protein
MKNLKKKEFIQKTKKFFLLINLDSHILCRSK